MILVALEQLQVDENAAPNVVSKCGRKKSKPRKRMKVMPCSTPTILPMVI
jgi:hypothetical protein